MYNNAVGGASAYAAFPQGHNPVIKLHPCGADYRDNLENPAARSITTAAAWTYPYARVIWWAGGAIPFPPSSSEPEPFAPRMGQAPIYGDRE